MELYCMWCGERLDAGEGHAGCPGCGTDYSSLVVSEAEVRTEEEVIIERSVCMDCVQIKRRPEAGLLDAQTHPVPDPVAVYP
ncbi:MAG: hypothetical protein GXO65_06775 [Euryarchaeota archaeon]|nr:hypothetical protein [Euryarchaeota archaeon]